MRARLHIRGGKRRLREGKVSIGLITLYDALNCAMQYYFASDKGKALAIKEGDDLRDDKTLYRILMDSGVLGGKLDYGAFDELVGRALEEELSSYDYHPIVSEIDAVMATLGVMPFDESKLPPEPPNAE
jgi:hypothetical protein